MFHSKGFWYDWTYFQWQGFDKPIPTRIMMIINLSDFDIIYNMGQYSDIIPYDVEQNTIPHVTKGNE